MMFFSLQQNSLLGSAASIGPSAMKEIPALLSQLPSSIRQIIQSLSPATSSILGGINGSLDNLRDGNNSVLTMERMKRIMSFGTIGETYSNSNSISNQINNQRYDIPSNSSPGGSDQSLTRDILKGLLARTTTSASAPTPATSSSSSSATAAPIQSKNTWVGNEEDLRHFHIYQSGKASEIISFQFVKTNSVGYNVGVMEALRAGLNQDYITFNSDNQTTGNAITFLVSSTPGEGNIHPCEQADTGRSYQDGLNGGNAWVERLKKDELITRRLFSSA